MAPRLVEYANAGFALAGHMLETVAGQPWEELLIERLFVAAASGPNPGATATDEAVGKMIQEFLQ